MSEIIYKSYLTPNKIEAVQMKQILSSLLLESPFFEPKKYGEIFADLKFSSENMDIRVQKLLDFFIEKDELLAQSGKDYLYILPDKEHKEFFGTVTISSAKKKNPIVLFSEKLGIVTNQLNSPFSFSSVNEQYKKSFNREVKRDGFSDIVVTVKDYTQGLTNAYWRMWFGKEYVDFIGKERLDSAPVYDAKYENGIYFVQLYESPFDWNTTEGINITENFKDAVGREMFYDPEDPEKKLSAPDFSHLIRYK